MDSLTASNMFLNDIFAPKLSDEEPYVKTNRAARKEIRRNYRPGNFRTWRKRKLGIN